MKTICIVVIIFLIPILSCFARNIYRYKKNLPLEKNVIGRLVNFLIKKK